MKAHSPASANAQAAANPKTFKQRDEWMRAVLAADLPHAAVRVAIRVALHLRIETGACVPGYAALADELRLSQRSVIRLIAALERAGWIGVERPGWRRANSFKLLRGDNVVTSEHAADVTALSPQDRPEVTNSAFWGDKSGQSEVTTTVTHKEAKRKAKRKAENQSQTPDLPFDDLKKEPCERKSKPDDQPQQDEVAKAFDEFWRVYPRKEARDAALARYRRAVKHGADPSAINTGAKAYAANEHTRIQRGEDPKYTAQAKNWLRDGRWKDPPPDGVVLDGVTGEPISQPPAQRDGYRAKSWAEIGAELLAEVGDGTFH